MTVPFRIVDGVVKDLRFLPVLAAWVGGRVTELEVRPPAPHAW
jgi:hypothetical protein